MDGSTDWLIPDWPAPQTVRACITTRSQGDSAGPFASFNLAEHVGDSLAQVQRNRQHLAETLQCQPTWLNQVHGASVVAADAAQLHTADASVTAEIGLACCVMSADCLPVLFADQTGSCVAAAHAGWRGLAAGVLENTVASMQVAPQQIMAWMGPQLVLLFLRWVTKCVRLLYSSTRLPHRLLCRAIIHSVGWRIFTSWRASV